MPAAALIAACTSCAARIHAAAEVELQRDLAGALGADDEVIVVRPGIWPNWRSSEAVMQGLDGFGAGAGELGGDQDGGEVDLGQRRDRQGVVAERAGQQDGERQQPGGDGAGDERGGDAAQGGALWARWVASCGGGTEAGAWRCTDRRGVRCWRGGSTTAAAPTTTMRWQAVARGAAGNEVGAFGPRLICFRIRLPSTCCEIMLGPSRRRRERSGSIRRCSGQQRR